jgi:hypothetical protein
MTNTDYLVKYDWAPFRKQAGTRLRKEWGYYDSVVKAIGQLEADGAAILKRIKKMHEEQGLPWPPEEQDETA